MESEQDVRESPDRALESSVDAEGGFKGRELHEFRAEHEGEFLEPISRSHEVEPFGDPDRLAKRINPDFDDRSGSYRVNCADCARSVERTWRGHEEEAAGRSSRIDSRGYVEPRGEQSSETEEWAGEKFTTTPAPEELRARLEAAGHGSSAIVHTQYSLDGDRIGHAYNVVNHQGEIRVLDGQTGETQPWVTNEIYDLGQDQTHKAMAWNRRGERIW